jgi:hypothetical protein
MGEGGYGLINPKQYCHIYACVYVIFADELSTFYERTLDRSHSAHIDVQGQAWQLKQSAQLRQAALAENLQTIN